MAERILSKDEIIYREGDRGDTFFQVAEGTALVMIGYGQPNATVLTALTPGQFFGEMSAMGGYQRSATVVAGEDGTRLFEFAERDLDRWFAERPELILDLLKYRGARIRTLSKDYEDACAILEDLNAQKGRPRSESLLNKIRRIASYYRPSASKPSVEEKARQADHKDGYVKRVASFMPGTVIYRAGEPGTCMYDIHWGRVGIYSDYGTPDQRKLTELSVNEFFGEMGMLCGDPRSARPSPWTRTPPSRASIRRTCRSSFRRIRTRCGWSSSTSPEGCAA